MANRLLTSLADGTDQLIVHPQQHNYANASLINLAYNVKDYGALGDGTTDDTTAIQDAINAAQAVSPLGGVVWFPAGTYKITAALVITNHVTVDGPGQINSTNLTDFCFHIHDCSHVQIRNITVQHVSPVTRLSVHNFYVIDVTNIEFSNVKMLASVGAGINAVRVQHSAVINCTVTGALADGIHYENNLEDIIIIGNRVYGTADDAITVQGYIGNSSFSKNCHIIGNYVYQCKSRGIAVLGVQNATVEANTIESTQRFGIYVYTESGTYNHQITQGITVTNNVMRNCGSYNGGTDSAIRVGNDNASYPCTDVQLTGNVITTPYSHFFNVGTSGIDGVKNLIIRANICKGPMSTSTGNGVNAINVENMIISDNVFQQCRGHTIYVESDCTGALLVSNNVIDEGGGGSFGSYAAIAMRAPRGQVYNNVIKETAVPQLAYDVLNDGSGQDSSIWGNFRTDGGDMRVQADFTGQTALLTHRRIASWDRAAAPTAGTWKQGDWCMNFNPVAGGFFGWVCVTGGSPGTWKSFGAISA